MSRHASIAPIVSSWILARPIEAPPDAKNFFMNCSRLRDWAFEQRCSNLELYLAYIDKYGPTITTLEFLFYLGLHERV